jgi:hypothetical protein
MTTTDSPEYRAAVKEMAVRKLNERSEKLLLETGYVGTVPLDKDGEPLFPKSIIRKAISQLQAEAAGSKGYN